MNSRYYTEENVKEIEFYQLPKGIIKNKFYRSLSLGAKLLYSILRDRQTNSLKNGWKDEKNNVFFYYDCNKLAELLNISTSTLNRHKKELVKFELLNQHRQGQGKPNKMYLLKVENAMISENDNSSIANITKLEKSKSLCSKNELSNNDLIKNEYKKEDIHITTGKNCNDASILGKYENTTDLANHISKHYKSDEVTEAIICFYLFYYEKFNTKHSRLTDEQMIKVITTTDDCFYDGYISETNIKDTIELYFNEYVKEKRKYYSMQEFFQLYNFVIWSARNM